MDQQKNNKLIEQCTMNYKKEQRTDGRQGGRNKVGIAQTPSIPSIGT